MNDRSTSTPSQQAKAMVGRSFQLADSYVVGREKIREFARAIQDNSPAHWSEAAAGRLGWPGLVAPATFPAIIWSQTQRALLDSVLSGYDFGQILHTAQTIRMHRPLVAGDRVRTDLSIEGYRQFGDKDMLTTRIDLTDDRGELVQSAKSTLVAHLGATSIAALGRQVDRVIMSGQASGDRQAKLARLGPAPDPIAAAQAAGLLDRGADVRSATPARAHIPRPSISISKVEKGTELPRDSVSVSRGDLVNYAGVSGDGNPIHFSDRVAETLGLPNVVVPGLLTMGLGARYLSNWLGDPAALRDYQVRFSGFVPVPAACSSEVEFSGVVRSVDPAQRQATIAITATCQGNKLFGKAIAQVQLA